MSDFQSRIIAFNNMYGLPTPTVPGLLPGGATAERLRRFKEILLDEVAEVDAILASLDNEDDAKVLANIADWLGDIQVYCASEMRKFGLNNDDVLSIIMDSNFSKLGADGQPIIANGKVQKGPNYWKPEPMLESMIEKELAQPAPAQAQVGANAVQVGGSHYKTNHGLQHWDMVNMFNLDYFQGQITKYVFRWKSKNGLQDLQKAAHFLQKYMELNAHMGETKPVPAPEQDRDPTPAEVVEMIKLGKPIPAQDSNTWWQFEGAFGDGTCLFSCRVCKHQHRAAAAPGHPHGCGAQGALEASDAA